MSRETLAEDCNQCTPISRVPICRGAALMTLLLLEGGDSRCICTLMALHLEGWVGECISQISHTVHCSLCQHEDKFSNKVTNTTMANLFLDHCPSFNHFFPEYWQRVWNTMFIISSRIYVFWSVYEIFRIGPKLLWLKVHIQVASDHV